MREACKFKIQVLVKSSDKVPLDPVQMSYWVSRNLIVDHVHRVKLLALNSALERLQFILKLLRLVRKIIIPTL